MCAKRLPKPVPLQGNRISDLSDEFGEEVVAPAGTFEFASEGALGVFSANEIEGEVAQDGEVLRAAIEAVSRLILVHDDIEGPVEAVLDAPVGADDRAKALDRERRAEEIVGRFGGGFAAVSRLRVSFPMAARPGHW